MPDLSPDDQCWILVESLAEDEPDRALAKAIGDISDPEPWNNARRHLQFAQGVLDKLTHLGWRIVRSHV